jgi:Ser/Thr protein kinase RdoA (MazF antagonist)
LRDQAVSQLPHTVTHGDFWASNICVSDEGSTVLDLDCYSFEPRVTDFARAANWYYQTRSASENASLFRHFQEKARLSVQEAEALPLMMCAHDLYYAIGHVLLFLHENPESQARLLARIQFEIRAPERYQQDRDRIRHMFMRDAW